MQPINAIAVLLILGLQLMVMGINDNSKSYKITGGVIMLIGCILNIIAHFIKLE